MAKTENLLDVKGLENPVSSILFGLLLGDGHMRYPTRFSRTPRLEVKSIYKKYLLNLQSVMESAGLKCRVSKECKGCYQIFVLRTACTQGLTPFYDMFYSNKVKVIPTTECLLEYLSPLSLYHLYVGDGSLNYYSKEKKHKYSYRIYTNAFFLSDVCRLVTVLRKKFGIEFCMKTLKTLKKDGSSQCYIGLYLFIESP